ncbi:MAG: GFA family protein [Gammaproteobacteria bacterium]|nr:GFA family protein [Gammaproteobacteria bacterium]MBV9621984.1 GFA family protein [Gammaproteobacteria bacterium]
MSEALGPRGGGCLCGAVRYAVHGPLRDVIACHCEQCRRTTGHFMAATAAARAHVRIVRPDGLRWYESSPQARRGFCERCGSTLFWDGQGLPHLSIAAGTLDDSRGLKIAAHIFVADKGDYYEIPPGTPHIPGGAFSLPVPAA